MHMCVFCFGSFCLIEFCLFVLIFDVARAFVVVKEERKKMKCGGQRGRVNLGKIEGEKVYDQNILYENINEKMKLEASQKENKSLKKLKNYAHS